jgi:hypothetical protein
VAARAWLVREHQRQVGAVRLSERNAATSHWRSERGGVRKKKLRMMPVIQSDGRLSARHSHFVFFHHFSNPSPARYFARSSMKSVQLLIL